MVRVTLEDRAVGADAKRESKQAFLDAYLIWLRGGEKSGMAWLTSLILDWDERMIAAYAAGRVSRRLGEWAAELQSHLVACERWATTARVDDFVLQAKIDELHRWGFGTGITIRNISFNLSEAKPLNILQQRLIAWTHMMSRALKELFDIIVTHRAVV